MPNARSSHSALTPRGGGVGIYIPVLVEVGWLLSSGRLDSAKITAIGKGESTPVTKPEDCKGTKPTAKLIACLQPDRRVEVEVTGTR